MLWGGLTLSPLSFTGGTLMNTKFLSSRGRSPGRLNLPLSRIIPPRESKVELLVTLLPSFPHFDGFAKDKRLSGVRLNSAMLQTFDLERELSLINPNTVQIPLYF